MFRVERAVNMRMEWGENDKYKKNHLEMLEIRNTFIDCMKCN